MSELPMMPWWPRNFLAATLGWTIVERGLYQSLLDAQWELRSLPNDEVELAAIARATPDEFSTAWPRVKGKFVALEDGRLVNEKLEEHRALAFEYRDKRRAAGVAGGKASAIARVKQASNDRSTDGAAGVKANVKHTSTSTSIDKPTTAISTKSPSGWPKGWTQDKEDFFQQFKGYYPKRAGNQPWSRARKAINARLKEEFKWDELLVGTKRYARFCEATGKINTETVMQAATFCGPDKPFLQDWVTPAKTRMTLEQANRICIRENNLRMQGESEDNFIDRMMKLG